MIPVGVQDRMSDSCTTTADTPNTDYKTFTSDIQTRSAKPKQPQQNSNTDIDEQLISPRATDQPQGTASSGPQDAIVLATRAIRTEANPTVTQARKSERWDKWQEAINSELKMLHDLGCYEEIERHAVPRGKQIIPTKMDLKTKYNASGEIIKLKTRLWTQH